MTWSRKGEGAGMEKTRLIQRLLKPLPPLRSAKGGFNPFSFGGGLRNGGLAEKTAEALSKIWEFDCMGFAEFEWGVVPQALEEIAGYIKAGKAATGTVTLKENTPVYYICRKGLEGNVEKRIEVLAGREGKLKLKAHCGLQDYLKGEEYASDYAGWLELNNGFMVFVDEEMYTATLSFFGIKTPHVAGKK